MCVPTPLTRALAEASACKRARQGRPVSFVHAARPPVRRERRKLGSVMLANEKILVGESKTF